MLAHKSAIRQCRRSLRRMATNKRNKSVLRTQVKKLRDLIAAKDKEGAKKLLPDVISAIDKTVTKGAIHKKKGSRFKSRLTRQVEAITPAALK